MKKISLLIVIALLLSACSSTTLDGAGKELKDAIANVTDSENKYVQMVKGGYMEDNPDLTYEDAFVAFFGTPRWKYFKGEDGQDVVEFTGDCTYRDVQVKARIQFVVDEENGTFEATYLAFNDVPQDALTLSAVIGKAFEEAEAVRTGSSLDKEADTSGQILFRGFTMQEMFRMGENDIISTFGEPTKYTDSLIEYGGYDSATWMYFSFTLSPEPYIDEFGGESELFTFNGQSLEQEFDAIVDILGNDYFIQSAGYEWATYEWDIGDIAFIFYVSDDDIAYSIFVHKLDGDTPIDSDAYSGGDSWYDDSWYEVYGNLDSDLYGRWRAQDGSLIEFSDNGVVLNANFRIWPNLLFFHDWVNPYYVTWQTSNGTITFTSYFTEDLTYEITTGRKYDKNASEYIDVDELRISGYREGVRIDSSESGGIAGTWGWQDAGGGGTYRILYPDGTGLWSVSGSNYPITWSADDETFYLQYESTASYDYYILGDVMEFFFSDGSKTFVKVSN